MLFSNTRSLLAAMSVSASLVVGSVGIDSHTTTYNLLHRVGSFSSPGEWSIRGKVELASAGRSPGIVADIAADVGQNNVSSTATTGGSSFSSTLSSGEVKALHDQALSPEASGLIYELALSPWNSPSSLDGMPSTSVKLCHLRQSHPDLPTLDDQLTVHVRSSATTVPAQDGKTAVVTPFGLSYRIRDIQLGSDGCPVPNGAKIAQVKEEARKERQRQAARRSRRKPSDVDSPPSSAAGVGPAVEFRTDFHVSAPTKPHTPPLKAPLPTREDGTVQTPEPEKTLLQKYWYYLIPVAVLILMPATEDDPAKQGAEGHASSEAVGTGMGAKRLK